MPRSARSKSATDIYHIMLRGINRQHIFHDDEDNKKFLHTLSECKTNSEFELFGYCLMGNHVHLLLKEGTERLELIFKRIGVRYVYWYNRKYQRCGHLFQDRFRSEAVENDPYFLTALRYIHQNPKKAGLCKQLGEYKWSSYRDYTNNNGITDREFALDIIGENNFVRFMNEENDDNCLEFTDRENRITDEKLTEEIKKICRLDAHLILNEPREVMREVLREILKLEGVSTRQLSRVTGISKNVIWSL